MSCLGKMLGNPGLAKLERSPASKPSLWLVEAGAPQQLWVSFFLARKSSRPEQRSLCWPLARARSSARAKVWSQQGSSKPGFRSARLGFPGAPIPSLLGRMVTPLQPKTTPWCFLQHTLSTLITGKKNACASSYCVVVKNDRV